MARTKKKGQKLGGQLQSARAKHDTALEEEILGKIAEKKTSKVKKSKAKDGAHGENAKTGKQESRKPGQDAKKEKRRTHRQGLVDVLTSDMAFEEQKARELIKKMNSNFTMSQMSRAGQALHELSEGYFTEAEFKAKVAEVNRVDVQAVREAAHEKAERKAERNSKLGGTKKAKKAAVKAAEKEQKRAAKAASSRVPELQQHQPTHNSASSQQNLQMDGTLQGEVAQPGSDGFSMEFWMGLAGSRAAAAVAAM